MSIAFHPGSHTQTILSNGWSVAFWDRFGKSISSDELAEWLRDIDAGEIILIIDACQSAGIVGGSGFKPGPLGSRGRARRRGINQHLAHYQAHSSSQSNSTFLRTGIRILSSTQRPRPGSPPIWRQRAFCRHLSGYIRTLTAGGFVQSWIT